jgi:hypothetical protein
MFWYFQSSNLSKFRYFWKYEVFTFTIILIIKESFTSKKSTIDFKIIKRSEDVQFITFEKRNALT